MTGAAHGTPVIQPVTITVMSITPATAVPGAPVTIIGTVRNAGAVPITSPVARALLGGALLVGRDAVSDWAVSTDVRPATEVVHAPLGKTLAPAAVTRFVLTIPAAVISHGQPFAVLPLQVDVVGKTPAATTAQVLGSQRTFLPALSSVKAYVPLSIAFLVPLTLDPDPALHGMDSDARSAAWVRAIGPGSRLDRLIAGTDSTKVTWAIDPAVLGPPPAAVDPVAEPTPTPSASAASLPGSTAGPDPVTAATSALVSRLREAAPRHTLWSLPYGDPDIAALLHLTSGNQALSALVNHPSTVGPAVGPARTDIAWPVDGTLTTADEAQLRRAFSSQGLAGTVTSSSTLTRPNGQTGNASRKSSGGLALLAADDSLSRAFAQTSSTTSGALAIQRFLADSMALLGERPGTPDRSVLVAAPRAFAGDPAVLGTFFTAVAEAKWLVPTTTDQLLIASGAAVPEAPVLGKAGASASAAVAPAQLPGDPDPLTPGTPLLTSAQLQAGPGTRSAIRGIASIRDDGRPFQARWDDAQDQLLSVRWRDHPAGPAAIDAATRAAISAVSHGVRVIPSSVNFFADKGVLQVTVVNDLAIPVHDVRLALTPAQPRLVIEEHPEPLKIGANSRTNVPLHVTAIAAGLVPIEAALSTPNGTPLGEDARVDVRVQPPSSWIYWVLGALATVILALGTYRSLRRGSTRASRTAAQEPDFDD